MAVAATPTALRRVAEAIEGVVADAIPWERWEDVFGQDLIAGRRTNHRRDGDCDRRGGQQQLVAVHEIISFVEVTPTWSLSSWDQQNSLGRSAVYLGGRKELFSSTYFLDAACWTLLTLGLGLLLAMVANRSVGDHL
jgi:hypothetical protein